MCEISQKLAKMTLSADSEGVARLLKVSAQSSLSFKASRGSLSTAQQSMPCFVIRQIIYMVDDVDRKQWPSSQR